MEPVSDGCADTGEQPREDVLDRQAGRHVRRVDCRGEDTQRQDPEHAWGSAGGAGIVEVLTWCERKPVLTQLTVFLSAVFQPLQQTGEGAESILHPLLHSARP